MSKIGVHGTWDYTRRQPRRATDADLGRPDRRLAIANDSVRPCRCGNCDWCDLAQPLCDYCEAPVKRGHVNGLAYCSAGCGQIEGHTHLGVADE